MIKNRVQIVFIFFKICQMFSFTSAKVQSLTHNTFTSNDQLKTSILCHIEPVFPTR